VLHPAREVLEPLLMLADQGQDRRLSGGRDLVPQYGQQWRLRLHAGGPRPLPGSDKAFPGTATRGGPHRKPACGPGACPGSVFRLPLLSSHRSCGEFANCDAGTGSHGQVSCRGDLSPRVRSMPPTQEDRQATSTAPEDDFTTLFAQVFGLEKALLLAPQFPVEDVYGGSRFVDYALRTTDEKVA